MGDVDASKERWDRTQGCEHQQGCPLDVLPFPPWLQPAQC